MKFKTVRIYMIILLLVLAIPAVQTGFKLVPEPELGGYIENADKPAINFKEYLDNTLTESVETYLKRTYGFRAYFIRIYNQYRFSLFNKAAPFGIIVGRDKHLFAKQYIDTHYGRDFIGRDSIDSKIGKLKFLQEELNKAGKNILVVITSSKGTFHEEYIPGHMKGPDTITNYKYYVQKLSENNIKHIDFNKYFLEIKGTREYPLYARHGIHWSIYGSYIVVDSLLKFIEHSEHIDLPDMIIESIDEDNARSTDKDILWAMNTIWKIRDCKYGYPKFSYNKEDKDTLSALVISDSFYYTLAYYQFLENAFNDSEFWFYNKDVYPKRNGKKLNVSDLDFRKEVDKFDYYILIANESQLRAFAWDFIEDLHAVYNQHEQPFSQNNH